MSEEREVPTRVVTTAAVPAGAGMTTGDGEYAQGSEATVMAVAGAGYGFQGWYDAGGLVSLEASYTFAIGNADVELEGHFRAVPGCGNCDYGREAPASAGIGEGRLSCCRGAPALSVAAHQPPSPPTWWWPIVRADWWCGEYEGRGSDDGG